MTASSIAWTPLFLNAEPQSIGTISFLIVRMRRPCLISSTERSWPSRYLCIRSSLASAAASTIFSRHFFASSTRLAGISRRSYLVPLRRVVPVDRLHFDQVDDALELFLRADRDLDRHRIALEPGAD